MLEPTAQRFHLDLSPYLRHIWFAFGLFLVIDILKRNRGLSIKLIKYRNAFAGGKLVLSYLVIGIISLIVGEGYWIGLGTIFTTHEEARFRDAKQFQVAFGGNVKSVARGEHAVLFGGGSSSIGISGEPAFLTVYIQDGKLVVDASLKDNTILVANEFSKGNTKWDRNFDKDAFEVVDENGTPMLQIVYVTDEQIYINGVFQGRKGLYFVSPEGLFKTPDKLEDVKGYPLAPIFRYPSNKNQGKRIK